MKELKAKLTVSPLLPLLIIVASFGILSAMGRKFWCACGTYMFWVGDIASSHTSQHLLDPYSFSHIQHGLLFAALLCWAKKPYLEIALLIEAGWEILENTPLIIDRYRAATASLNYYGDSILNSMGDLLSCAMGFYVAMRVPRSVSISLFIAIETVMVIVLRDSLLLNVIMLLYPLEAIKEWQMGSG